MFNCLKRFYHTNIKLGVFNIQNLSNKKISDKNIFTNLSNIIKKYDLIYILELVDIDVLDKITNNLNSSCLIYNKYNYRYSQKTGLTSQSAEYYGVIYNNNIKIVNENILSCDDEKFDRKPWFVHLNIKNKNIKCLINHISPNNVDKELNYLNYIYNIIYLTDPNSYYILLGDYNADLPYLPKKDRINNDLFLNNNLVNITNNLITNIAKNEKKYDKIFISSNIIDNLKIINNNNDNDKYCNIDNLIMNHKLSSEDVKKISDHYPIYIELLL